MALRDPSTIQRAERVGLGVVTPDVGLAVVASFMHSMAAGGSQLEALQVGVVSPFTWSTFMRQLEGSSFFGEFAEHVAAPSVPAYSKHSGRAKHVKSARTMRRKSTPAVVVEEHHREALRRQVIETVSGILGSTVALDEPLMDAGLDSLGAVELRNGLAKAAVVELPSTLVFDYPSVGALA